MTIFDYIVLGIVALSMLLGFWRGLIREVFALITWIVAFIVARTFAGQVVQYMPASIETPSLRLMAAFVALLIGAFFVMMLVSAMLTAVLRKMGLGGADRGLGVLFGFVRGMAIVLILVLVGGMTTLPREPSWRQALSAEWFESVALKLKTWMPADLGKRIQYPPRGVQSAQRAPKSARVDRLGRRG